jgi:hypothetical protein
MEFLEGEFCNVIIIFSVSIVRIIFVHMSFHGTLSIHNYTCTMKKHFRSYVGYL